MSVNVNPIMAAIVEAAETLNTAPDDYINPDDGLKYCGKCHTPKDAGMICIKLAQAVAIIPSAKSFAP